MSTFLPPPVGELPTIEDRVTKQIVFNPVWLHWFLQLSKGLTSTGGGSGDVVGPGSSTANTIALFDGATGKLLKGVSGLGTSTEVLVGNAAGAPVWQAPSLQRNFMLGGM